VIYWETSALVKQSLAEVGTEQVLALRTKDLPHATSMITYSETFSALRRRVGERFLPAARYRTAIDLFKRDWPAFVRVQLDKEIIMLSAKLIERHPLRTLDAIHLASSSSFSNWSASPPYLCLPIVSCFRSPEPRT